MFLDFNEIAIDDEGKWFQNVFTSGPGFQLVQVFMENVLEQHINWYELINSDINFKNKLQINIQKEFKTTPDYIEFERTIDGYHMGVFLCIGKTFTTYLIKMLLQFLKMLKINSTISNNY